MIIFKPQQQKQELIFPQKMSNKAYCVVLFSGCIIILHVLDTSARHLPNGADIDSVRLTIFGNSDQDNAYLFKMPSQQLISANFQTPANMNIIPNASASSSVLPPGVTPNAPASSSVLPPGVTPNATASSSVLPPGVTPNAFTKAALSLPILQNFLDVDIDPYEAGNIIYSVELAYLNALGHPSPPTVANNDAEIIAGLNAFSIPLFLHLKGNTVENFLILQEIEFGPSVVQSFANSLENSLKSHVLNSNNALIHAIHEGYINFFQSLGLSFSVQAYVLSLIFHEEVYANIY